MDLPLPPPPTPIPPQSSSPVLPSIEDAKMREAGNIATHCSTIGNKLTQASNASSLTFMFEGVLRSLESALEPVKSDNTLSESQTAQIEAALKDFDARLRNIVIANDFQRRLNTLYLGKKGSEAMDRMNGHLENLHNKYDVEQFHMYNALTGHNTSPMSPPPHFDFPNKEDAVVSFIEKLEKEFGDRVGESL